MKWVRARVEIDQNGINKGHRYVVGWGDGLHGDGAILANPGDKYSSQFQWSTILGGEAVTNHTWGGSRDEGLYVRISRQYPNDKFDFSPQGYQRGDWLENEQDVIHIRLYNPFLARPFLQFAQSGDLGWHGTEFPFSEGDQKTFQYDVDDFWLTDENRWWGKAEKGIKWTVRRNDDSDYKEFVIRLSV